MATVNFCDRCESFGKSHAMGSVTYRTDPTQANTTKEICPGCVGEFMEWLNNDVTTTREKAYKDPWKPEDNETTGEILTEQTGGNVIKAIAAAVEKELKPNKTMSAKKGTDYNG